MPERPNAKLHGHPVKEIGYRGSAAWERPGAAGGDAARHRRRDSEQTTPSLWPYAELHCKTNFSFLRGASHPEELVERAAELGYRALAVTDRNSLAGAVRMHLAAKQHGLKLVIGAEIVPTDAPPVVLLAPTRAAYGRLCRLITAGRRRAIKGDCRITFADIAEHAEGLIALCLPVEIRAATVRERLALGVGGRGDEGTEARRHEGEGSRDQGIEGSRGATASATTPPLRLRGRRPRSGIERLPIPPVDTQHSDHFRYSPFAIHYSPPDPGPADYPDTTASLVSSLLAYRDIFGDWAYLAAELSYGEDDDARLAQLTEWSRRSGLPLVAAGDVHYHDPERRRLHDVLTCIRHQCTLHEAGTRLLSNASRHLPEPNDAARRFSACPEAVRRTVEIADSCTFTLDELRYEYPRELCPDDAVPMDYLTELTWAGARERYPEGIPDSVRRTIEHELGLIRELKYEPYFLTVWDVVQFARSRDILCQGRGSAANSAVCYCLGITSVDPARIDLLFERFVSRERNEPPDIDVDFEHERREEVFQYIYGKYGRDRAAITAEVITYRPRSAVRDVGKALGLSLDAVDALARRIDWWAGAAVPEAIIREAGLQPDDHTVRTLTELVSELIGFPRHLSQHVGGFVITEGPLCETVPIENAAMPDRTFIEWDKDDLDALGMLKVDCLALGMLTAINKCFRLIRDEPDQGSRDQGIKGSRIGDEGGLRSVEDQYVSGSNCVAKGDWAGHGGLRGDARNAGRREIRVDGTDAPGGGFGCEQHRGGERSPDASGLCVIPRRGRRIARGTGNADDHIPGFKDAPGHDRRHGTDSGDAPPTPGIDRQSPPETSQRRREADRLQELNEYAASRRAEDRSSADSRSLDPSIPRSLTEVPPEDPAIYDMICAADTVGVFQIESRAQMSMLPRLRPRHFYDLVIEVAIVRPGPIQGGMVHPYLRRRAGEEPVTFPSEAIQQVLGKTLGVPLFQEQAMRLAVVAAGFTPGEADQLRRAMAAWKRHGGLEPFRDKLIRGMIGNGYAAEYAERCFKQICGFGEYGFPESHAASFALLVYVSAWLKRYHPAAFTASLLNSQPMGFYAPAQLVRDAADHGVPVRGPDVNASEYDCTLEDGGGGHRHEGTEARRHEGEGSRDQGIEGSRDGGTEGRRDAGAEVVSAWGRGGPAMRLGFRLIRGVSEAKVTGLVSARRDGPFGTVADVARRSGASRDTLARLAAADAFGSLGLTRREALWQVLDLEDGPPGLFDGLEPAEPRAALPPLDLRERVVQDYEMIGMSLAAHPMSLVRSELDAIGVVRNAALRQARHGGRIAVAGLVLVRQRPSTANGVVFMTIEDESGIANLIVRPRVWERCRASARAAVAVAAEGTVERQGAVVHVMVHRMENLSHRLQSLAPQSRDFH